MIFVVMTVKELIDELNKFPKDKYVTFMAWDEIEVENIPCIFNSIEDEGDVHIYLEPNIIL